jgi:hypothetical protein
VKAAAATPSNNPSAEYDKLAAFVRAHLDMGIAYRAAGPEPPR